MKLVYTAAVIFLCAACSTDIQRNDIQAMSHLKDISRTINIFWEKNSKLPKTMDELIDSGFLIKQDEKLSSNLYYYPLSDRSFFLALSNTTITFSPNSESSQTLVKGAKNANAFYLIARVSKECEVIETASHLLVVKDRPDSIRQAQQP